MGQNPWKDPGLRFRRRRLPHLEVPDATYFVTFRCRRGVELPFSVRVVVMDAIRRLENGSINLDAAVVMPDHVHALFRIACSEPLNQVLRRLKGVTARDLNLILGRRGPLWTQESFDHVVRNDIEWHQKVEYIRTNPVKRGLVTKSEDYPWVYVPCKETEK